MHARCICRLLRVGDKSGPDVTSLIMLNESPREMSRLEVEQAQLPTIAKMLTPSKNNRRSATAPGDKALAAPDKQRKDLIGTAQVSKTLVPGLYACLLLQDMIFRRAERTSEL